MPLPLRITKNEHRKTRDWTTRQGGPGPAGGGRHLRPDQAFARLRGGAGPAHPDGPDHARGDAAGPAQLARAGGLHPATAGPRRRGLHDLQDPHDVPGLRAAQRGDLEPPRRPPGHSGGPRPPLYSSRRAAPAHQRPAGRDEPDRAPARAPRVPPQARAGPAGLPAPPHRTPRRDRAGAGPAAPRLRPEQRPAEAQLRPLLRGPHDLLAGCPHRAGHGPQVRGHPLRLDRRADDAAGSQREPRVPARRRLVARARPSWLRIHSCSLESGRRSRANRTFPGRER